MFLFSGFVLALCLSYTRESFTCEVMTFILSIMSRMRLRMPCVKWIVDGEEKRKRVNLVGVVFDIRNKKGKWSPPPPGTGPVGSSKPSGTSDGPRG